MISSQNNFTIIPALIGFLLALTWLVSRFNFFRKYASHIKEIDHKEVILPSFAVIVSPFLFTYMFWGESCGVIKSTIPFFIFFLGINHRNKQRLDSVKANVNQSLRIIKRKIGLNRQSIDYNNGLLEAESKVKSNNDDEQVFAEHYFRSLLPLYEDFVKLDNLRDIANERETIKIDQLLEQESLLVLREITPLIDEINYEIQLRNNIIFSPRDEQDRLSNNDRIRLKVCTGNFSMLSRQFLDMAHQAKDIKEIQI